MFDNALARLRGHGRCDMPCRWDELLDDEGLEMEDASQAEQPHSASSSDLEGDASDRELESDGEAPQQGTLRFYMDHLQDPIHPGASATSATLLCAHAGEALGQNQRQLL